MIVLISFHEKEVSSLLQREAAIVPAEFRRHHTKHIHPVAQLQNYDHGEPAGTQPGVRTLPGRQGHWNLLKKKQKTIYKQSTATPLNKEPSSGKGWINRNKPEQKRSQNLNNRGLNLRWLFINCLHKGASLINARILLAAGRSD